MEYQELVTIMADRTSYTRREIRQIVRILVDVIESTLEEGRDVQIWRLGKFRNVEAGARTGRHPVTGKVIPIPARRRLKFEPSVDLRDRVRQSGDKFKRENLETRYGLPKKENRYGKVWSRNRPKQSSERKEGGSRG